MKNIFARYKLLLMILVAVFFNLVYFYYGLNTFGLSVDKPYKFSGDAQDYIESVEEMLNGNSFSFFKTNEDTEFVSNYSDKEHFNESVYYAFRSPGYAFFYAPLRLVLSKHYAILAMLFFQIIITAIAKYILALLARKMTKSELVFYSSFVLLNLTPYYVQYNNLILTESLGFSFLVFFLYGSYSLFDKQILINKATLVQLAICGSFLTVAIMLRPFLALFLVFVGIFLILKYYNDLKKLFIIGLSVFSSFIIVDGIWVTRNYIKTNQFIPLASTMSFQDHKHQALVPIRNFCKDRGISDRWFDRESPVYWLITPTDTRNPSNISDKISRTDALKLVQFKDTFNKSYNQQLSLENRKELETNLAKIIEEYNQSYSTKNYLKTNIYEPLQSTFKILDQPNLSFLHHVKYPINVLGVFIQSFMLKLTFFLGVIATLISIIFGKRIWRWCSISSIALVCFFGFFKQTIEFRELYTYSGVFFINAVCICYKLVSKKTIYTIALFGISILIILILGYNQMHLEINW